MRSGAGRRRAHTDLPPILPFLLSPHTHTHTHTHTLLFCPFCVLHLQTQAWATSTLQPALTAATKLAGLEQACAVWKLKGQLLVHLAVPQYLNSLGDVLDTLESSEDEEVVL